MSSMNGNGTNGKHAPPPAAGQELSRRTVRVEDDAPGAELLQLPPWLQALRESMGSSIQGEDLKQIMQAQVEKAKQGDMKAASFVFNQAHRMVQSEQKRLTIVQNNYYGTPEDQRPDAPVVAEPGSAAKERKMRARVAAGEPLAGPADAHPLAMTDAEEKEFRRRQQDAEDAE